jgi:hypothetical protein
MSADSSGGVRSSRSLVASMIWARGRSSACRTRSASTRGRRRAGGRAADLDLELLGLLLADQQLLVLLDGADDRVVEFVAADADGVRNDEGAERGDRDLARASADVDDQGADRLADREPGPNRGRERLVDQRGVRGAGSERCLLDRAPLDGSDPARHAHHHVGSRMSSAEDTTDEVAQHLFGRLEIGDHAVSKRPCRCDVRRCAPDHLARLSADRVNLAAALVDRDDRRLKQDDPLATPEDHRIRGAQIDSKLPSRTRTSKPHPHRPCASLGPATRAPRPRPAQRADGDGGALPAGRPAIVMGGRYPNTRV